MNLIHRLEHLMRRTEHLIRRADQGDEEALAWAGFWNLTAISVAVLLAVAGLLWWLA